jgi:hypothetical protein
MDPLERLAVNNRKHRDVEAADQKEKWLMYPLALVVSVLGVFLYSAFYYYLFTADETFLYLQFIGMAKQVWVLAMLFSAGIGGLFFSMSLASLVWIQLFIKQVGGQAKTLGVLIISGAFLLISFAFFLLSKWLHFIIIANKQSITQYLTFGYNEAPYLLLIFVNFFIIFVAIEILKAFYLIVKSPFKAKNQALKIAPNK